MTEFEGQVPNPPENAPDDRDDEIARLEAEIARRNDPRAKRLAELRAQLAQLDAPEDAKNVVRPDGLVGPKHTPWDDIPKAMSTPLDKIEDPTVREILIQLRDSRKEIERLNRLMATQGAPSIDAVPAQTAVLHLSNGKVIRHATSIPTHHYDEDDEQLHRVLSGHFEDAE